MTETQKFRTCLSWLHDRPLFFDKQGVEILYDALLRPEYRLQSVSRSVSQAEQVTKGVEGSVEMSASTDIGLLGKFVPGLDLSATLSGGAQAADSKENANTEQWQYVPVENPYRQLIWLTWHYHKEFQQRFKLVHAQNTDELEGMFAKDFSQALPPALVFLEIPGESEAGAGPAIIPTACETIWPDESIKVQPVYSLIMNALSNRALGQSTPATIALPEYPDGFEEEIQSKRKAYWDWFSEHYSAQVTMVELEKALAGVRRIRRIDYRVGLGSGVPSCHLQICPSPDDSVMTFAYSMIKRGHKHGLRIVGLLRSEPDIQVLAVFER